MGPSRLSEANPGPPRGGGQDRQVCGRGVTLYKSKSFPLSSNACSSPKSDMRTIQKRKRSNGPYAGFKRRRFVRRFRGRSRRNAFSLTTRSQGASTAFKFRGRKLSKRSWRRHIYRDTIADQHYRSITASLLLLTTPQPVTDVAVAFIPAIPATTIPAINDPLPFWKVNATINQPMQPVDLISGVSSWPNWAAPANPDPKGLVIRGGRYYITANCQSTNDPCNIRIQLAFAKQNFNSAGGASGNTLSAWFTSINAITPKPLTWTYNQQPDYQAYFYPPILDRVVRLLPGEDVSIVKSIKPTRIDPAVMRLGGGWYPYWFVYASQSAGNIAGNPQVGFVTGYNLSFSCTQDSD